MKKEIAEIYKLNEGIGFIEVLGGGFASLMCVDGSPIVMSWPDYEGSVARYLVRSGMTNVEESLESLRYILDGGFRSNHSISSQIFPVLELFVPGQYDLIYRDHCADCEYIEYNSDWDFEKSFDQFYPSEFNLVFTQSLEHLNPVRVNYYIARIKADHCPIAITATASNGRCEFVIDGHHKLAAYNQLREDPAFISISRRNAPPLSTKTFDYYFSSKHPKADHYRRVTKDKD